MLGAAGGGKADPSGGRGFGQIRERVSGDVGAGYFEVEIGAGGVSRAADLADFLSARDSRAFAYQVAFVMAVNRGVAVVVTNDHGVAVAVQGAGKNPDAAVGRIDGSAGRS